MAEKVLVTGGLGYVGGRVSAYLAQKADLHVSVGTRRKDALRPHWLQNGDIVPMDLESRASLENACTGAKHVIHLAAMNEIDSARDPEKALAVNGRGTLRLLEAAKEAGVERFIYFSTAHVYGTPLKGVITEYTLPRPVHPYAITHKTAEDFVLAAHDSGDLTSVVLRLSNAIGAPNSIYADRWTLVVNDLCRQAVERRRLSLRSSGVQERNFIPLEDVEKAASHFLEVKTRMCRDGLFNLGGEHSIRIIDLARLIAKRCEVLLGFVPVIERLEPRGDEEFEALKYDMEKAKATGFSLTCDIKRAIDSTLLFCDEAFGGRNEE